MLLKRILLEKSFCIWMIISLIIILLLPVFMGIGLFLKSIPLFEIQSVTDLLLSFQWSPHNKQFGFGYFIVGSLYVTLIALLLAAPVCLLTALYITQYTRSRMMNVIHPVMDILAGLPSVIYGVWGILVVVPFISKIIAPICNLNSSGYSILAGGIVLAVMCIPYILNMLIEVFNNVPVGLKEASLSLGATLWETIKKVVIKKSYQGIISAFGLGIAKAFGETMAVMMVVGNMVQFKLNPLEAGYPLPALIANNYGEMLSIPLYDSALMLASLLLLVIILLINLVFRYFIYRTQIL